MLRSSSPRSHEEHEEPLEIWGQRSGATAEMDLQTRSLSLRAETLNTEERSVEAVLATERRVEVFDYRSYERIEEMLLMDSGQFPARVVLLDTHSRYSVEMVRGSIREIRREGERLVGRLFFASDEDSIRAWEKVRDGHVTDVSIGYLVREAVDIEPNTEANVNGRDFKAGARTLRVVTSWELREGSLVPIGADQEAKTREAGRRPLGNQKETGTMNKKLRLYLEKLGLRAGAPDDEAQRYYEGLEGAHRDVADKLATPGDDGGSPRSHEGHEEVPGRTLAVELEGQRDAALRPAGVPLTGVVESTEVVGAGTTGSVMREAAAEAVRAERGRVTALRTLAGDDVPAEVLTRAIDEGWTQERAAEAFLTEVRSGRQDAVTGVGTIEVGEPQITGLGRALSDAIAMRTGYAPEEGEDHTARVREAARYQGVGLRQALSLMLEQEGVRTVSLGAEALLKRAISSMTIPNLLSDSMTKSLHAGYRTAEGTFVRWAGVENVSDFKIYREIRLSEFARLAEVGDAGELDYAGIEETKEEYSVKTYGRRFGITRKTIINDDLNALTKIPSMMGRAASRNVDILGYTLLQSNSAAGPTMLEDGKKLFATDHKVKGGTVSNKLTGGSSALSSAGLTGGKKLFRKMKEPGGEFVDVTPRYLITSGELEHTALELVHSSQILLAATGSTDATVVRGNKNVHQGTLEPIISPRITSSTAWYLAASPNDLPTLVVVYLNGRREPFLERRDPEAVLGIGYIVYHDAGVAAIDYRGVQINAGA